MQGKVKFFLEKEKYGFITDDAGTDYFVHFTGTLDRIDKDDVVEFDPVPGKKGLKAINVHRVKETIKI